MFETSSKSAEARNREGKGRARPAYWAVPLLFVVTLTLGACNREKGAPPPPGPGTVGQEGKPSVMESDREKEQKVKVELVKGDLQDMLKRVDTKIAKMKENMSSVDEATREQYKKAIPVLEQQKEKGEAALHEVETSSAEKWGEVQKKAEDALNQMRKAYDRVVHD